MHNANCANWNLNGKKNQAYLDKRGWTADMIDMAIENGPKGTSINLANGSACTVYLYPGTGNQYAVIENDSRSIVQVSDFSDSGWFPHPDIIWDP